MQDKLHETFFVSSGFLEVQPQVVTILADTALRSEEFDQAAAEAAKQVERAEKEKVPLDTELQLSINLLRALEGIRKTRK